MSIYRGAGGASDATDDATVNAVAGYASAAATSATNAATSATNAATSASAANTSVTSAATSASQAATSATNAAGFYNNTVTQAFFAQQSAYAAAASEGESATSASNASTYASSALNAAINANTSAGEAQDAVYTTNNNADNAAASAASALAIYGNTTAMNAAVTASQTAATNAATSASSSATSAAEALVYKDDAAGLASDANTAYLAASDEADIATEQANVAVSAANSALAIYGNTTLMNAAVGAAQAAAEAASDSSVTATTQADIATTQANNASTSATQAAASAAGATAIVTGVASTRPSIRPSLLLDFANTRVLDPRITFTRASTATFYDNDTSAIAEQNLFPYSQEFDNAAWAKTDATVTANATNAPDGTTTAEAVLEAATTAVHGVIAGSITTVSGQAYILSAYIKGNGRSFCVLYDSQSGVGKYFDITAGGGGSVLGDYIGAPAGASLTYAGNDWYRCSITVTATSTIRCRLYAASAGTTVSYLGDITKGLFLWGAQLEQRATATAYTPTTTAAITNYIPVMQTAASGAARFDCNPVTRESLGLLIEEARTNLVTYSEQFDDASWGKTNIVVTANTIVSPDGTLDGEKIVENATAGVEHYIEKTGLLTTNQAYTQSIYIKAGETTTFELGVVAVGSPSTVSIASYTISSGIISTSGIQGIISSSTATAVGNGWYRCTVSYTLSGTVTSHRMRIYPRGDGVYLGDGYSGLYIWGAQVEAGAFATSYIPTVASQVTRAADAASMTGTNFSSWYNVGQGTMFADYYQNISTASGGGLLAFSDNTNNNRIILSADGGNSASIQPGFFVTVGVTQAGITAGTGTPNSFNKIVGAYAVDNFAASFNAAAVVSDTSGLLPVVDRAYIGGGATGTTLINGTIKRIAYYPVRLSNTELQGLTA